MKTTLDIVRLASTGVNLIIDGSSKTSMDLRRIVDTVAAHNGHVTIKNCGNKTTVDLIGICQTHPQNVTIEL